jgi:hypothetical protein
MTTSGVFMMMKWPLRSANDLLAVSGKRQQFSLQLGSARTIIRGDADERFVGERVADRQRAFSCRCLSARMLLVFPSIG